MIGGPAPYGYMPIDISADPLVSAARGNAPLGSVVAFVRYDTGPAQFDVDWQMNISTTITTRYDMVLIINLSALPITGLRFNSQQLRQFTPLQRTAFGGSNLPTTTNTLQPGDVYAILIPETSTGFNADATSLVPGNNIPFTIASGQVRYLTLPCPADFNSDGFQNPDDLADFITCFFLEVQFPGSCPDSDFNDDGFSNPDDIADFITAFFTTPC